MKRLGLITGIALLIVGIGAVADRFLDWGSVEEVVSHSDQETQEGASSRSLSPEDLSGVGEGALHSIPLEEIVSGGPPKDGIPSIDDPQFESTDAAREYLHDDDAGLGLVVGDIARFYPYRILVWHEIVNDTILDTPVLVTYCPLCATGIVFERRVNGAPEEFGVSGLLWQSNLLMYNRANNPEDESLWSQVLGEAVVGTHTGASLKVVPSNTVRFGEWVSAYPDTDVLARPKLSLRDYDQDPYGDYYTDNRLVFNVSFSDDRLHPKVFVLGIEVDGVQKAYVKEDLPVGTTVDVVGDKTVTIQRTEAGEVTFMHDAEVIPSIGAFWFSWAAVHEETLLYTP